jgi:hypothetical protein
MAQKYALIPMKTLEKIKEKHANISSDDSEDVKKDILSLFPNRFKQRAAVVLQYAMRFAELDENHRIIHADGSIGSHIVDLIKYFIYPPVMNVERPLDALDFAIKLKEHGIPESSITRNLFSQSVPRKVRSSKMEASPRHSKFKKNVKPQNDFNWFKL